MRELARLRRMSIVYTMYILEPIAANLQKIKKFKKRKEARKHRNIIIIIRKIQEIFRQNYEICENYRLMLGTDSDGDQYVSVQYRDDYYDQWRERRKIYFDNFYGEKRPVMSILKDIFDFL